MRRAAIAPALLGILLLAGPAAAAEYRDAYKEGVDAYEAGDYATAVENLRQAITERSEERVGFRRYVPYFYLGLALAASGDCPGALDAFAESERQGQVRRLREHTELQLRQKECQAVVEEVGAAVTAAGEALGDARDAAARVAALSRHQDLAPVWATGSLSLASREEAAADLLRRAEARVQEGEGRADKGLVVEGQELAVRARSAFDKLATDARERLKNVNERTAEAVSELEEVEGSARRVVRSLDDLEPYPAELGQRVAEVEGILGRVVDQKATARPEELAALQDELTVALSRLRRAATRPPAALADAAESFLSGRYEHVLEVLGDTRYSDPRAATHACLLRAAARHALSRLAGERAGRLAEAAAADLAACPKQLSFEPDERFFSPAFVEFFRAQRPAAGASRSAAGGP